MVTIKDVARHLNCSPATISLIINNRPLAKNISPKTKTRVLKAIEDLGYVPNDYAKSLRTGNTRVLGILCFDITDPFTMTILRGIEQELNERDYFYQLVDVRNDLAMLDRFFVRIKSQGISGVIAMTNSLTLAPGELTTRISPKSFFISVGRAIESLNMPAIRLDNAEGVRLALEHFHHLGHRRVAFVIGPQQIHDAVERRECIAKTCRTLGLRMNPGLMEEVTDFPATAAGGAQAIRRIIERRIAFSAVLCFDDLTAYGVVQELHRQGLAVPRDVSVIGHDDIWPSKMLTPALTTIQVPMIEMGLASARLLVELQSGGAATRKLAGSRDVVFKPELIVRESTAPARKRG